MNQQKSWKSCVVCHWSWYVSSLEYLGES